MVPEEIFSIRSFYTPIRKRSIAKQIAANAGRHFSYEMQSWLTRTKGGKQPISNYESAALPAELLRRTNEAEDDIPPPLGQGMSRSAAGDGGREFGMKDRVPTREAVASSRFRFDIATLPATIVELAGGPYFECPCPVRPATPPQV